ncbi:hypothetical protein OQH61_03945 [Helicobacter sp. MIT 21-1697]|uniref:hypothetical protein n=1 Tax=Helicobacter sp. MIT 21-1697 TaxID=2993733 RepID=UPI00224B99E1|nr:hypothetical protein [Helicobacter sp. MIT 21-1697]MCX2716883.1 hypothetical protein [Helicobacter sp. MIT 21-1697]
MLTRTALFVAAAIFVGCGGGDSTDYSKLDKNKEPFFKDFINEPVKDGELFAYYPAPYKDSQLVCNNDLATEALRRQNIPFIQIFKYLDEESKREGTLVGIPMSYNFYKYPEVKRAFATPLRVTKQGSGYVRNNNTDKGIKINREYFSIDALEKRAQVHQKSSITYVNKFIKDKPEAECRIVE